MKAQIDNFRGKNDSSFSHECNNTGANYSSLCREYFILVDIEDGEFKGNGQFEHEDEHKNDYLNMILYILPTALLPNEDQHQCAGTGNGKANNCDDFSPCFRNDKVRGDIGSQLRYSYSESIDVDIEFEFIKHEAGCIKAEANGAEEKDEK